MGQLLERNRAQIVELSGILPEVYQDIDLDGQIVVPGVRVCDSRWRLVRDKVKPHDVVLDIGSSEGYFAHRIAQTYPDSLVISVESSPLLCTIQRLVFEAEGIYNVVVCEKRISPDDLRKWSSCVECFDVTLLLSVLHHFPSNDMEGVLASLEKMSSTIIAEVPNVDEAVACGGDAKMEAAFATSRYGLLGFAPSHLDKDLDRALRYWTPRGTWRGRDAYVGVSHEGRHRFDVSNETGVWKINDRDIISGANVYNLFRLFKVVWPPVDWWTFRAKAAYTRMSFVSDVAPWNLLVTSSGLRAIDYTTEFPPGDRVGYADTEELARFFLEKTQ